MPVKSELMNPWLICDAILRLCICVIVCLAYFFWDNSELPIDVDHLQNILLFVFQSFVLYYSVAKTYFTIKQACCGLHAYVTPLFSNLQIVINVLCIIAGAFLCNLCRNSDKAVLNQSALWFAFLNVHFILNLFMTAIAHREIQTFIAGIQFLNDKSSNKCSEEEAILCYQNLYYDRTFGQNLNLWIDCSLKTVYNYEYFKLQRYINALNTISLCEPSSLSSKLDELRSEMNEHTNKLLNQDKDLVRWKSLAEKPSIIQPQLDYLRAFRNPA